MRRSRAGDVIVWRYPERYIESMPVLVKVDFEVFGFLNGITFIQRAKNLADQLGVRGWIRQSRYGSAVGQIQGEKDRVDEMALWLRHTGSPGSRIECVDYQNWHVIDGYDYMRFNARV